MIRDRVKELRRVRAGDLQPHPDNWRTHPQQQQEVLRGVLAEVGYADALLARELADGSLQLIDGHLRAETTPEMVVPVLVVDLNDAEAARVLLTHDPLSALAGTDAEPLANLLSRTEFESEAVSQMLGRLAEKSGAMELAAIELPDEVEIPECYQVLVECEDETEQAKLFEQMRKEGRRCRLLTL